MHTAHGVFRVTATNKSTHHHQAIEAGRSSVKPSKQNKIKHKITIRDLEEAGTTPVDSRSASVPIFSQQTICGRIAREKELETKEAAEEEEVGCTECFFFVCVGVLHRSDAWCPSTG